MRTVEFVEPATSRAGRRFEPLGEVQLHDLILDVAASVPSKGSDAIVIPEMPSPLGLPDFVAIIGGKDWLRRRARSGVSATLVPADCHLLASMANSRPLKLETIARRAGWNEPDAREVARRLLRTGAIEELANGTLRRNGDIEPSGYVFGIEAKLKDWRRAMIQGRNYRTWANNYVVVLGDIGAQANLRARESVAADGGGLYTREGWVARPQRRDPAMSSRILGFEYVYAAIGLKPSL